MRRLQSTAAHAGCLVACVVALLTGLSSSTVEAAAAAAGDLLQPAAKLLPNDLLPGASGPAMFGYTLALSSDGTTALVGAPYANAQNGQAWIFTRSGSGWVQQGPSLTPSEPFTGNAELGASVAISADGNTVLIGADGEDGTGAAWVFTRSGGAWNEQGMLLPSDADILSFAGSSVALSADGSTALVGGSGDNNYTGAAWIFTRAGTTWTQQGLKLTASDEMGPGDFGRSATMSGDGSLALIGGFTDNSHNGAVWAFAKVGGAWVQQGAKLTPSDETGAGLFGDGLAITPDGTTAVIGGSYDDSNIGAAWVFTRSGATWTQQGPKLVPNDVTGIGYVGFGVGISPDAATVVVGGSADTNGVGALWLFRRTGATWSQAGTKQTAPNADPSENFGMSIAVSATTVLASGIGDNSSAGAVFAYEREQPAAPVAPPSKSGPPDLVATLSVDTPHAKVGDGLVYRVTVSDKAGSGGASGVKVAITLPAGMSVTSTYTDRGPGCTVTGTQLLCDVAWISPGVDAHLIIRATAASAGSLITTAVAREEEPDAALADNTSTATVVIDGTSQQVQSAGPTRLGIQLVGKAKVGQTLRTSYWTLAGMTATRPGYSWQLCEAHSCRVIAGEHRASLVVRRAFVGYTLRAVISATVGTQICSATSAATARVR